MRKQANLILSWLLLEDAERQGSCWSEQERQGFAAFMASCSEAGSIIAIMIYVSLACITYWLLNLLGLLDTSLLTFGGTCQAVALSPYAPHPSSTVQAVVHLVARKPGLPRWILPPAPWAQTRSLRHRLERVASTSPPASVFEGYQDPPLPSHEAVRHYLPLLFPKTADTPIR